MRPGGLGPAGLDVAVTITTGRPPLEITDVRLEMAERKLCFRRGGRGRAIAVFLGDPALSAPRYDYADAIVPEADARRPTLDPEQANPE